MLRIIIITFTILIMAAFVEANELALSDDYSVTRGGRLYDKWFKINENGIKPEGENPVYPDTGKYKGNKHSDFRCKECHGWDYQGKDGQYGNGKHYTGFKGVLDAKNMSSKQLIKILRDSNHNFSNDMLSHRDVNDTINFLQKGTIDMSRFISENGEPKGDLKLGEAYYQTICSGCHGLEGKDEDTAPPLGELANKNPWEVLHKIRMGQPKAEMPALYSLDPQVAVDIVKYLRVLPKE
ncbi:MAG: cytochrome c [Gammaproteobacteria bacterium]|nr:cytochrome c [Gammaproteobacteria bacterium]